ncbi:MULTISPECIES: hypothetical protein [Okeania]|uniref:Uncharacterized protein n=1 Tax=Okeania hirsuta TaxID=1458930 RepID=A0A3N6P2W3_9CYAN|nr:MULTISPECIES: hypothetical protein [Okeania]NEP43649.1 hypothetical protein [Okeania sp. SIO2H7]NET17025.1 hypothetical protein [Okeania sp. SIO1H6]NEP75477.1 hypothetical protein [Okeania sp. SIO2G5]NEP87310.1 hypothetical protein [Okeania sp. SIO2C2]NEP96353.1 hypothetical protein [Okeania sp. SIO2F5]
MNKVLYFVSIGILAFWILRGESVALNDEDMQLMALSDSASFSNQILAQVPDSPSSDSQSQSTIPSAEVPEKSNTVANLIQSTDPEEREKVLQQNLGNEVDDTTIQPSQTISVPTGRDPFSVVPEIPVPELAPEESSVAQLPEIQGQQLPGLPTLPETTAPTTWQQNVRRIVPSDDSPIVAQQRRRRPLPNTSPFENSFVEHGC